MAEETKEVKTQKRKRYVYGSSYDFTAVIRGSGYTEIGKDGHGKPILQPMKAIRVPFTNGVFELNEEFAQAVNVDIETVHTMISALPGYGGLNNEEKKYRGKQFWLVESPDHLIDEKGKKLQAEAARIADTRVVHVMGGARAAR